MLTACPRQENGTEPADSANPHLAYARSLLEEESLLPELKRLSRLHAEAGRLEGLSGGDGESRYRLVSALENGFVSLTLHDTGGGGDYVLSFRLPEAGGQPETIRAEPTNGGYQFEVNCSKELSLSLSARWLQGRYLQVSREYLLSAGGKAAELSEEARSWSIDGEWMPYRCLPSERGPYGLLQEPTATWQSAVYPDEALLPSIAMYDSLRGIQIMAADEHARQLSRSYRLSWQLDGSYAAGSQLMLTYQPRDLFSADDQPAKLEPGRPLRDSIFVEPFRIAARSHDPLLIEAQTTEVLRRMRDATYACHMRSSPPRQFADGAVLPARRWLELKTEKTADDFLRIASGIWGVNLSLDSVADAERGIARERLITLVEKQEWLGPQDGRQSLGQAADFLGRLAAEQGSLLRDGVLLLPAEDERVSAVSAALNMKAAELLRAGNPDTLIAAELLPRLAMPAFADCQLSRVPGNAGFDFNVRMKNIMLYELFWLRPRIVQDPEQASLSSLVLASTLSVAGHEILPELQGFAGFEAFALNQEGLRKAAGDIAILHSLPAESSYGAGGERPPQATEVVAALPANWNGATHIWIAFAGCGGSVASDYSNAITVSWPGGSWQGQLPPGIWKVEHPSADKVEPGDVVLLRQSYITPAGPDVS